MTTAREIAAALSAKLALDKIAGYGDWPLPSPLDDEITTLARAYVQADESERAVVRKLLPADSSTALLAFAERMAVLAVRIGEPIRVRDGLVAIAMENCRLDPREDILVLSLLNHSAAKLGADPVRLFDDVASLAEGRTSELLMSFPRRENELRDIAAMGYTEEASADGFVYRRDW